MNFQFAHWITNFGDTGVILPLATILLIALWRMESVQAAWVFARAIFICLASMALLKIFFLSCGHTLGSSIASPSGHTSLTSFFYGVIATLFWARSPGSLGIAAILATLALVLCVAFSRLVLGAHNLPEVLLGGSIGTLSLVCFAQPYLKLPHPDLRLGRIALLLVPLFLLTYGTILPAESMLRNLIPFFQIGICAR